MSTEPTQSLRDQELRRMLVTTSTAEPVRPRRRPVVWHAVRAERSRHYDDPTRRGS